MQLIARALAMLIALSLSASLGACSSGEDDDASAPISPGAPSVSGSASPSGASAGDELTVAPPGETAEQFIRRWYALLNRAQATGETAGIAEASGPDCDSCKDFVALVSRIYSNGGSIRGGTDTILSLESEGDTQWVVRLRAKPTSYRESRDGEIKTLPGGERRSRLYLASVGGRWIVGATETLA